MPTLEHAQSVLSRVYGYSDFRSGQAECIDAFLQHHDVLAVMPTGGGKSICYQIPAMLGSGVTIVISPLVALMKDQVDRLLKHSVAVATLHAGLDRSEITAILELAGQGRLRMLYVSPERLSSPAFRRQLGRIPVQYVAVDEAHCISEWGHDFRPSYADIPRIFEHIPRVPILAVTATASADVRDDIVRTLGMRSPTIIVRGFDRPNLSLGVVNTDAKVDVIANWATQNKGASAIVYAGSRRRTEEITHELRGQGIQADTYHAGLQSNIRSKVQDAFLSDVQPLLVATSAFGMGVDKPNIRHVFHVDLTMTLEAYYQEAGRAGRDGNPAQCTMLYHPSDRGLMEYFISATHPTETHIRAVYSYLCSLAKSGIAHLGVLPTLEVDSAGIAAALSLPTRVADSVLSVLEQESVLTRIPPTSALHVTLVSSVDRLHDWAERCPPEERAVVDVLRRTAGVLASAKSPVPFSLEQLSKTAEVPPRVVLVALQMLQNARVIVFQAPQATASLTFLVSPSDTIPIDIDERNRRRLHALGKLNSVVEYAETPSCKRNFILQYFGEEPSSSKCGHCSSCDKTRTVDFSDALSRTTVDRLECVVRVVFQLDGRFGRTIIADVLSGSATTRIEESGAVSCIDFGALRNQPRSVIMAAIDMAINRGYVRRTDGEFPVIQVAPAGYALIGTNLPVVLARIASPQRLAHLTPRGVADVPPVLASLHARYTLDQLAHHVGLTKALTVAALEDAMQNGHHVDRGNLVPEDLFNDVCSIIATNQRATLRYVMAELPFRVDTATLRLALLFAMRSFHQHRKGAS